VPGVSFNELGATVARSEGADEAQGPISRMSKSPHG
jgi:hypothetical protein